MWFKRALFVYHAALLVANTEALPKKNGGTLLQRQHAVEDLDAPVLLRRQQASRNETKSVEPVPATHERSTSQFIIVSTSDQSQAISVSKSSTPLVVTTSTANSLQELPRLSSTSNLVSVTSSKTNIYASPRSTTVIQVETISSAREQSSSKAGSATSTNLSSDATSDKRTAIVSSAVTSSHESSTSSQLSSVVLGSVLTITSHSTPMSTSQTMDPIQTSSIPLAESRSQQEVHDSSSSSSSILSTSVLLQASQPTLTATASLAASDSHISIPTPTPSVVSHSTTTTNNDPTPLSDSDSNTLLNSEAKTITENITPSTILLPATNPTSNGFPVSSQSTSNVVTSAVRSTTAIIPIPTDTPISTSSQFSEFPVANLTSPSPVMSTAISTTMATMTSPEALHGGIQSTGQNSSRPTTSTAAISSKYDATWPVESGSKVSNGSTITMNPVLAGSPTLVPQSKSVSQNINNQTTTQRVEASATTLSTAISSAAPSSSMAGNPKNSSAILPSSVLVVSATSSIPSQTLPQTDQATLAWTNATIRSSLTNNGSAQPTNIFSNPNQTRNGELDKTLTPFLPNSSIAMTPLATTISTSNVVTATGLVMISETRTSDSTTLLAFVGMQATTTLPATATSTASQAAVAPPPTPLTTTQTAGVAVGSTAGVLLAVIAAIFLVRRYHANQAARRTSTGSIYPKVAYIYDPTNRGNGGNSGNSSSALMSGGANGLSPEPPPYTRTNNQRQSNRFTTRYSDPGNPFRDPVNSYRDMEEPAQEHYDGGRISFQAPGDAATAFAAAVAGFAAAEEHSPTASRYPSLQSPYHVAYPSSTLSPLLSNSKLYHRHTRSMSRSSFNSFSNQYPPLSPYTQQPSQYLESERAMTILDAPEEPFEYDILLPVDAQTETPDSVMVQAPPPTPRTPIHMTQQNGSLVSPVSPTGTSDFQQSQEWLNASLTSNSSTTLGQLERFSLAYDSSTGATYIRLASKNSSPQQPAPSVSPVSPIKPVHRGWDDIKRFSSGSSSRSSQITPAPLSFNAPPPLKLSPPPPNKKKSLLQLRRKEPALAGQGHVMKPSISQPLAVKPSLKYNKDSAFEAQRRSLLAKLHSMGESQTQGPVSQAPSPSSSVYSREPGSKRKRDENVAAAAANTRLTSNFF